LFGIDDLDNKTLKDIQEGQFMRHPFDGVTRREALGAMAAAAAAALVPGAAARAQVAVTTLALGEEGAATKALNEAGGNAAVTTEPFGEEAGKVTSRMTPGLEDGKAKPTDKEGEGGGAATHRVGEGGGTAPPTAAINEGGGPITRRLGEGGRGTNLVPVHADTQELKDEQFKAIWGELSDKDAAKGVQACAELYGAKKVVPFLKDNLKADKLKLPQADEKKVAKLIADLDSDSFDVREEAEAALAKLGSGAAAAIEKAIKTAKSAEQKMRLARLLEKSKDQPELTRARRAIEVLVALRTDEAKELLTALSKGGDKEWLTQAAKKGLERAKAKLPERKEPVPPKTDAVPPIRPVAPLPIDR
jgi:hypothetical protein